MMMDTKALLGAAALLATVSLNAEAKLYKWVDENGTTHYGETIPPQYADRNVQTFDKGRVHKPDAKARDKDASQRARGLTPEQEQAERRDNALLNTYSSEKEIDLARDRNLQQVEARISSYATLLKSAQDNLLSLQQERERLVKQGRNIPKSLEEDLVDAQNRIAKFQTDLDNSNEELATVKAKYAADKARYRELNGLPPAAEGQ